MPIDIPKVIAKVIHMPGVRLTIKNVGIKRLNEVKLFNEISGVVCLVSAHTIKIMKIPANLISI